MKGEKSSRGAPLGGLPAFAGSAAAVLGVSLAIAWPLWSAATSHRRAFTLAAGALLLAALAFGAARALLRRAAERRRGP